MRTNIMKSAFVRFAFGFASAATAVVFATPAHAGRGSSPTAIAEAIASGSTDAIASELERAELLMCPSCVKLVRPLIDHDDGRVRQVAAWWLARRGLQSELFIDMAYRLAQPDSTKARNAANVLGELRSMKAIEPLGAALNNPIFDGAARAAMAAALGEIGELHALPSLRQALSAREPAVRVAVLESLRGLRGFDDATVAAVAIGDADATVRREAIHSVGFLRGRALKHSSGQSVVQPLVDRVLRDADADVREAAAWALGEIGAPADVAGQALGQAARTDASPLVRSVASASLGKLTR
jgi:HEAT repeat protein